MKILAIDTSTSVMGVSLLDEKKLYAEKITNLKKNHSIHLMPTIDELFTETGWTPNDIDAIAVAKGPGSYTGVRIGVTTAKTFAWTMGIPIIGVSTLEVMAYEHKHYPNLISPILDARRGQVYAGLYKFENGSLTLKENDRIILLTNWLEIIEQYKEKIIFVGDDLALHKETINEGLAGIVEFSSSIFNGPRPSVLGWIAKEKYEKEEFENTFDFAPSYLQLAEAEAKWLEKQNS